MTLKLKAIIFDVDGTLADTEEIHLQAFNKAFLQQGLKWRWSQAQYADLLKTTGGKERIAAYLATRNLTAASQAAVTAQIPDIHALKTAIYTRIVKSGVVSLRDGVRRLIDDATSAGVTLAIATTTSFDNIRVLMEKTLGKGALERFSVIGAGDDVVAKKPAPDVYEYVLQRLKLQPEECVALEDSCNGLTAAKGAGLFTVVTPSYWTRNEDFRAADLIVPHLGTSTTPLPEGVARLVGNTVLGVRELDACLSRPRAGA